MLYYGLERSRSFDREADGLDKLSFQYVIFGMKDLYKHVAEFDGRNKDIVGVFVTSDRAFMKARNKGFRRVFVVPTLVGITATDVIEADPSQTKLTWWEDFCFGMLGLGNREGWKDT